MKSYLKVFITIFLLISTTTIIIAGYDNDDSKIITTQDMIKSCNKKIKINELKMKKIYHKLNKSLLSDNQKILLENSQSNWVKYRNSTCQFVSTEFEGGSLAPLSYVTCKNEMTINRLKELENIYKSRTANRVIDE